MTVELATGGKCLRCWKVVPDVKDDNEQLKIERAQLEIHCPSN